MKLGIILSLLLVLVFGGVAFVMFRGIPDGPTSATNASALAPVDPPRELQPLATASESGLSATALYDQAFAYYKKRDRAFDNQRATDSDNAAIAELLMRASRRDVAEPGWLDRGLPMELSPQAEFGAALESVSFAGLVYGEQMQSQGNDKQAAEAFLAVWALGYHAFTSNQRLYARSQGLSIMRESLDYLRPVAGEVDIDTADIDAWQQWASALQRRYQDKLKIVLNVKPEMGDLFNLAENDADPAFRIAATLRMGPAQYHAGSKANKRKLQELIDKAKNSDNPLIAEAANVAASTSAQDVRRM